MADSRRFRFRLLGGATMEGPHGVLDRLLARHQSVALLVLLATSPNQILTRDKVLSFLWPETTARRGRQTLNVVLHGLRRALGADAILSINDDLKLNDEVVWTDVVEFARAIKEERWEDAVSLYGGPLLDGVYLRDTREFEDCVRRIRSECGRDFQYCLERIADRAEIDGDLSEAVRRWRQLLTEEPSSARVTLRLMRALDAVGDRAQALAIAERHSSLLEEEFGADPDPEVEALADRLRSSPQGGYGLGEEALAGNGPVVPPLVASGRRTSLVAPLAGVLVLIALAIGVLVLRDTGPHLDGRVVATVFENRTGDSRLDPLAAVAADWMTRGFARTGLVSVISMPGLLRELQQQKGNPEVAPGSLDFRALSAKAGADLLVHGSYMLEGDSLVAEAKVIDLVTGDVLSAIEPVRGSVERPLEPFEKLGEKTVAVTVSLSDERFESWLHAASQPPNYEAYLNFAEGIDLLCRGGTERAVELLHAAADLDRGFRSPLLWAVYGHRQLGEWARADSILTELAGVRGELAPWDQAMLDYHLSLQKGDHVGAYRGMKRVVELVPDSEWRFKLAQEALDIGRPWEAIDLLSDIDPQSGWLNGRSWYWLTLSSAYHLQGDYESELAVARQGMEEFSNTGMLMIELRALAALGRQDQILDKVDEALVNPRTAGWLWFQILKELHAHGRVDTARAVVDRVGPRFDRPIADSEDPYEYQVRAFFFYYAREWEASRPYVEWLAEGSVDPDFRGMLAVVDFHTGKREAVVETARWMKTYDNAPYNYLAQYILWRARLAAVRGDRESAVSLLREAARRGAGINAIDAHSDPHFATMRAYPPLVALLTLKG